jgi:hypothetical protein
MYINNAYREYNQAPYFEQIMSRLKSDKIVSDINIDLILSLKAYRLSELNFFLY